MNPGRHFNSIGQGLFPSLFEASARLDLGQGHLIFCLSLLFSDFDRNGLPMAHEIVRPFNRQLLPERLGHEVIDSDHMEISNCWYRTVNCGPLQFPFLIARMKKLMQKHFAFEAEIMKRFNRSLPACHQIEHDLLLQFCDNAAKLSQYSWAKAQQLLRRDFPRHVREHIICMDQLVVLCVNTHGELGLCRKTKTRLQDH